MANVHEAAEEATSEVISEAMAWCMEARKLLGLGPPATTGNGEAKPERPVAKSAVRVAAALVEFRKEVKTKKKAAPTADLGSFESGMDAIAAGLKAAAEKKDAAGVAAQEVNLAALKAEFAAAEAKTAAEAKSEAVPGEVTGALAAAQKAVGELQAHAGKAAIAGELTALESTLTSAEGHIDKKEYDPAMALLAAIPGKAATLLDLAKQAEIHREALEEALSNLASAKSTLSKLKAQITSTFGGLPPAIDVDFSKLDSALDLESETDPVKIETAAEAAGDAMAAIDKKAQDLDGERTAYLADLALIEARVTGLASHTAAAEVPVKARIDPIEVDLAAAKALATAHDYGDAQKKLVEIAGDCATAMVFANDHAHYQAILADRQTRVDALTDSQQTDVQKMVTDVKAKLTLAKTNAADGKFAAAVELLGDVPQDCIDTAWAIKKAAEYTTLRTKIDGRIKSKESTREVAEVRDYIDEMKSLYTRSDYATTKDFAKSIGILQRVAALSSALYKAINFYKEFKRKHKGAEDKIKELKDHGGYDGVSETVDRMQSDLLYAEVRQREEAVVVATNVCLNIVKMGDQALPTAVAFKAYFDVLTDVETKIAPAQAWSTNIPASLADQIEAVQYWITTAKSKAQAKDYVGAKGDAERALVHFGNVVVAYNSIIASNSQRDEIRPHLDDMANHWREAFAEYRVVLATVETSAVPSIDGLVANGKAKAVTAKEATEESVPNFTRAKSDLNEAMEILFDAKERESMHGIYMSLRQIANRRRAAITNPDSKFTAALNTIKEKIEVEADGHAATFDFTDAEVVLDQATGCCIETEADVKYYTDYQALRNGAIQAALVKLDTAKGRAALDTEVPKFIRDITEADAQRDREEYNDALEALKALEKEGAVLRGKSDNYDNAKRKEKLSVTNRIGAIKNKPIVAKEWAAIKAAMDQMERCYEDRLFKEAYNIARRIGISTNYARAIVTRHAAYEVERKKAETALEQIRAVTCPAIADDIKTVELIYEKAKALADGRNFKHAMAQVVAVAPATVGPIAIGKAQELFAPSRKAADEAITALKKDFPDSDAATLRAEAQNVTLGNADALAEKKLYTEAQALTDSIPTACAAARNLAETQGEFDEALKKAKDGPTDSLDGLEDEIAGVAALLAKLVDRRPAGVIANLIKRIKSKLATAEDQRKKGDAAKAREALAEAADACAAANTKADKYNQVDTALKDAVRKVAAVRSKYPQPATVQTSLDEIKNDIARAQADADTDNFSMALGQLHSALEELSAVETLGADHEAYVAERGKIDPRVEALARHKCLYAAAEEFGEIRAWLVEADGKVGVRDYVEAMKFLVAATDLCDVATLKADMHNNEEITGDAIKNILAKPGGEKELDEIIKGLDPQAKRKATKKALELRFDMRLEQFSDKAGSTPDDDLDKKGPNILRFYDIMVKLPQGHTRGNPSLDLVRQMGTEGDDRGSGSFSASTRKIELTIGRANDKHAEIICQEWELGTVDDNCKPADGDPPSSRNWTANHEFGHSVDDSHSFMKTNGSGAAYGGWKEYGGATTEIAKVAAVEFEYDPKYIQSYLSGGKASLPDPGAVPPAEWDRCRIEAETWCDSIRVDRNIYYSASMCKKLKIGDRVYQEAYADRWVSYLYASRSQGVMGYQFRAPGEWFAELYAAYQTGKMNKSHPARKWLDKL